MKNAMVFIVLIALLSPCFASEEEIPQAVEAARTWLAMVDTAAYAESWEEASEYFKDAVPRKTWEQQLKAVRGPLGELISRELKQSHYTTTLPGAPDNEYVVITFETSFENKKTAMETVTPMKEDDGSWRVSGYYIK